jgi:hypothetical protein
LSVLRGTLACVTAMDPYGAWLLTSQRGVISRSQALSNGMTDHGIYHRLRPGGPWQRLLPGVYLTVTGEPTWEQRAVAAMLYAGPDGVITGLAALHLHDNRTPESALVDVLVPLSRQRASREFAVIHRTRRMPSREMCDLALRFAPVPRAVTDAVRQLTTLPEARAVVAAAVQRRKCTIAALAAELEAGPVRGSARLRSVLAEVADGARSVAEAEFRALILASDLPAPLFNADLYLDGEFLARPDAWWPQEGVVAEVDSREWHLLPEHWRRTMERGRRMAAAGVSHLHFSPSDVHDDPQALLAQIHGALRHGRPVPGITWKQADG